MTALIFEEKIFLLRPAADILFGALLEGADALGGECVVVPIICQWLLDLNTDLSVMPTYTIRCMATLAKRKSEARQPRELLHLVGALPGLVERKLDVLPCVRARAASRTPGACVTPPPPHRLLASPRAGTCSVSSWATCASAPAVWMSV